MATNVHRSAEPGRLRAEMFLEAVYARAFRARLAGHFPSLISADGPNGEIGAVVGFRSASEGPLFLERYLDNAVDAAVGGAFGEKVERDQIVEIGGLASDDPGLSPHLFAALAELLTECGYTHAVATVTRQLRRRFARIGFATKCLAPARRSRLVGDGAEWGAYYDRDPEVLAGLIPPALLALRRMISAGEAA